MTAGRRGVEHGAGDIQVMEPVVDQAQAQHLAAEDEREFAVALGARPETVAGQDDAPDEGEIPRPR